MKNLRNNSGSIIVFTTLMIVLLLVMVGMGLDTGWISFGRSQGQRAVDAAALAGAAGAAKGDLSAIEKNIEALNASNDYVKALGNPIDGTVGGNNVMLVKYDKASGKIIPAPDLSEANAVRVALEKNRPEVYGGGATNTGINSPLFLMPLLNLLGFDTASSANINVSAVATYNAIPGIPLALGGCNYGPDQAIPFDQSPSSGDGTDGQGNNSGWTTYTVRETNTPDIIARIRKIVNCQGGAAIDIGTPICLGNGTQPPVLQAFEELVDASGDTCYLAPVIDPTNVFNQCDMEVRAFAQVCLKAVCVPGATKNQNLCPEKLKGQKYILANVRSCSVKLTDPEVSQCYATTLVREKDISM